MNTRESGFTMIELIVVIVILGILAATALPKFIDLRSDAKAAALAGMAGSLSSAASLNYAGCSATNNLTSGTNATKCAKVTTCTDFSMVLQGGLPSGYTVALPGGGSASTTNGTTYTCNVVYTDTNSGTSTATWTAIAAGN